MSEYQNYEWQAFDRLLTIDEQAAVEGLSSHIEVSSNRAVVAYDWSDFRHDPKQVLLKYFDAHFFLANWGSLRLMFHFPEGFLDEATIDPYCDDEFVSFETSGKYQVLDLDFSPEGGRGWKGAESSPSLFIQLRTDLLEGDFRLLYLAWLKALTIYGEPIYCEEFDVEDSDDALYQQEPPVPPGLKELSPSLKEFIQVFEIDPFLVVAAAEACPELKKTPPVDYSKLVSLLPLSESNKFLERLAKGDASVGVALRKRLRALLPQKKDDPVRSQPIQQLCNRAKELEEIAKKRQVEAARQKHISEMKALPAREMQVWQRLEALLDNERKIASIYDRATANIEKLEQLAIFQNT